MVCCVAVESDIETAGSAGGFELRVIDHFTVMIVLVVCRHGFD